MNELVLKIYDLVTTSHNLYSVKWRDIYEIVPYSVMEAVGESPKVKEFLRQASLGYSVGDSIINAFGKGKLTNEEQEFLKAIYRALGSIAIFV